MGGFGAISELPLSAVPEFSGAATAMVYHTYVDWGGDGTFEGPYDDITDYVLSVPELYTGRRSDVSHDDPGKARIILDNSTGIFSPDNASSPLYGSIKRNRRIKQVATYNETTKTIWSGFLKTIELQTRETTSVSIAILHGRGALEQFRQGGADVAIQSSAKTTACASTLLDAYGWPAGDREIDTGLTTMFRWWPERGLSYLSHFRDLQDMEFGRVREGRDFKVVVDARDHIFNPPHDSAQATYGTGTLHIWNLRQLDTGAEVYNEFVCFARPYYQLSEIDLITISDIDNDLGGYPPKVPASGSITLYVDLPEDSEYKLVQSWGTPSFEANTAADGSGSDITTDVEISLTGYAYRAKLVITNANASDAYLIKLILPGIPLELGDIAEVRSEDSTSQDDYGINRYPYAGNRYADTTEAQQHADHAIALYKDPRTCLQFDVRANYDENHILDVINRETGDRIHITAGAAYGLYVDADFIIDSIRHDISNVYDHRMTITCTLAPTAELATTSASYSLFTRPQRREIEVFSSLPNAGDQGRVGILTSDNQVYRDTGSEWTASVPTTGLTGQITETQITDGAVTTPKLAANSVTAAKIEAGTITANEIAAGTITGDEIAASTITADKLSATYIEVTGAAADVNAGSTTIDGGKITTGTITATQIAASTITATELAASYIEVTGAAADVNAGATTIDGGKITTNSITATQIAAGTITATELAVSYIEVTGAAADVNAGSTTIDGGKITASSITADRMSVSTLSAIAADLGTVTAGTVTGATIQTAGDGNDRIKLSGTTLGIYDSDNNLIWALNDTGIWDDGAISSERSEPSGWDFSSFTADAAWHDLDLSSFVPAGMRNVTLRIAASVVSTGRTVMLRKNGNTQEYTAFRWTIPGAGTWYNSSTVRCDSNRVIEYKLINGFSSLNMSVDTYGP